MLAGIPEKGVFTGKLCLTIYGGRVFRRVIRHRLLNVLPEHRDRADHHKTSDPQGHGGVEKGQCGLEVHLETHEGTLLTGLSQDRSQMKNIRDLMGHHGPVEIDT